MSDLRTTLNRLLQEHIYLAGATSGSALGGRDAEFKAAAAALDRNSVALSGAIGLLYGAHAGAAFLPLWRKHIGFVVDYTGGVAAKDKGKQERAVADLIRYTGELGAFLNSANPHLPRSAVAGLVKDHVPTLTAVIDAQAAGDAAAAYTAMQTAAAHMSMIADPLAAAIGQQFPQRFSAR